MGFRNQVVNKDHTITVGNHKFYGYDRATREYLDWSRKINGPTNQSDSTVLESARKNHRDSSNDRSL